MGFSTQPYCPHWRSVFSSVFKEHIHISHGKPLVNRRKPIDQLAKGRTENLATAPESVNLSTDISFDFMGFQQANMSKPKWGLGLRAYDPKSSK